MIIVVGCHRSGTSLVAGLLHHSGLKMGGDSVFRPKPSTANKKGFYEDIRFRKINDKILKFNRYDVKSWRTDIPTIKGNKPLRREIRDLLGQMGDQVGFKDPRTCLTWHIWQPFLPEDTMILYVYRNPVAVAKSFIKRGDVKTLEHGLELWQIYNQRALPIQDYFDTVFVNYEGVLEQSCISALGIPDINNLIDLDLRRNPPEDIPVSCVSTWEKLTDYSFKNS